jgi:hypothetical protein
MMRTVSGWLSMGILALLVLGVATVGAESEKVSPDKLPKPVIDALKARFPVADVLSASKEVDNGKTIYEVNLKVKGVNISANVLAEGVITLIEKEIPAKDVPSAVTKAVEAKYPKATWKRAEEVTKIEDKKEKLAFYEVLLDTADKKTFELEVDPAGKILKETEKKAKNQEGNNQNNKDDKNKNNKDDKNKNDKDDKK